MQNTRRDFLKFGALSAASTLFFPRDVFNSYEARAEESGNDVVLRCCIMSDVHFNGSAESKEYKRFNRAIEFMYEYSANQSYKKFDALVVVGDMSNHGNEAELTLFKKAMDAAVKPGTEKLLCMGNHEFYGGNQKFWQSIFGVEPNRHYDVNGYRFIAISPEKGTMADGDYLYRVNWLKSELDEASKLDPDKPIFVFQHYPVSPTVYGGRGYDDWGAEDLYETLQHYPKVVDFSGHTHYPINNPRCAWQGCFTAFGTGTLSYLCHGHEGRRFSEAQYDDGGYGQFYIMEVRRDNSVTLKPYDLTSDSFFDLVYYVGKPGDVDDYVYTDKRYYTTEKPVWRDDTTVKYDVAEYKVVAEIKQAYSKDVVVGYRVDLEAQDAKTKAWEPTSAAYFWSRYHLRDMPETARFEFDSLEPDTCYRGQVTAYNAFMIESEKKQTIEFKTPVDPSLPEDRDAAEPRANFYDLRVVDGKLVNTPSADWTKERPWEPYGAPQIVNDPDAGCEVVQFNGKDCYRSKNVDEDYRKLRRLTIAAKFRLGDGKGEQCFFCCTQVGGVGLGYDFNKKVARLWAYINNTYQIIDAPVPTDRYVTAFATYDGKALVLYVDGKEAGRLETRGVITFTKDPTAKKFALGADVGPNDGVECLLNGRVAYAKLFTWALTAEQVANLSK